MKKIISILAFTSLLCCSCDYLDVVPEGKATEEDIWISPSRPVSRLWLPATNS